MSVFSYVLVKWWHTTLAMIILQCNILECKSGLGQLHKYSYIFWGYVHTQENLPYIDSSNLQVSATCGLYSSGDGPWRQTLASGRPHDIWTSQTVPVQKGPLYRDTRKVHLFYILPERSTNRIFNGINLNGSYNIMDKAIYDS